MMKTLYPWVVGAGVVLVGLTALFVGGCAQEGPFPGWKASGAEDRVIDRFARLVNDRDKGALDLLGPEAVLDDEPVTEKEAAARQTDFYLRSPELKIVTIRPGEPGRDGRWLRTPGRYTLVSHVQGSTPELRIRNDRGEVGSPSRLFIINPDLVVEVKAGKIHGISPELHRD